MLDTETKRKIDNCRDILVGKIPDPKSQVEQITIALIYKFMDDMDQLSIYQGGKPSFFTGEFEKYSWSSIFDRRLGGQELLNLYGEALVKMNQNPNIPQLFRDIFKNAFLPYRDPETLRLFLKEISGFTYDHSERLGDAFEYLLSVLSSQGEAGQFRTPRHIIDFIVKVVDPQLNESVLDPACGTAGFLISAYKHIRKNNPNLSAAQKKRLMNNFVGYDISYDMVRLSLVNMYLHRFPEPHIHEYDTLTYEDRWGETYDVIMANPPFMTPKGGIRPHSRFSIKAKRSEVLFVDYIAEHLNPSGRAGVIVPEGIIFQSQNAYKALRKMLVENYLWAVVSLPAGVFNPYSGVKTSILFMDKSLAKRIDKILFVKIENDGFDLGAQRRQIDQNDLPLAQKCLDIYKSKAPRHSERSEESHFSVSPQVHPGGSSGGILPFAVLKSEIANSGDYNLSGDRYRKIEQRGNKWPMVSLDDIVETVTPPLKLQKTEFHQQGTYPIIDQSQNEIAGWTNDADAVVRETKPLVIFGDHTCAVKYIDGPFVQGADGIKILKTSEKVLPKYLFYLLRSNPIESDGYKRHFSKLKETKIPFPPLDVQKKIVAEIDSYQKIIDSARQIVQNYKPTIKINPGWPLVELGKVCSQDRNQVLPDSKEAKILPYIGLEHIESNTGEILKTNIDESDNEIKSLTFAFDDRHVLYGKLRPYLNKVALPDFGGRCSTELIPLLPTKIDRSLLAFILRRNETIDFVMQSKTGTRMPRADIDLLLSLKIPLPSLEEQKQIVAQIESEQKIVNENKKLIEIFEKKISDTVSALWGKVETP